MAWNDDIAYAMAHIKLLTIPFGIWPLKKFTMFSLVRYIMTNCSLVLTLIILNSEMCHNCVSTYERIDLMMLISCFTLCIIKLISFRLYADNMINNFSSAINDYLAINTKEERTIMRHHAFIAKIICYNLIFFAYSTVTIFILTPIFTNDKNIEVNVSSEDILEYPMPTSCTLAHFQISKSLYMVIYVMQSAMLIVASNCNLGGDSLFFTIILHVCGQVELLKLKLTKFGMKNKHINEDFINMIRRHHYLLNQAKLLSDTISIMLLMQLSLSCLLISVLGFQFILATKMYDIVIFSKTGMTIFVMLLQLFMYCYVGDYLKYQMDDIAYAIYYSNWYCLSTKWTKNIIFVILRSQQHVQIIAGGFFVVDIETYMTILKTSLSYLSVLRIMLDT